jgi:probable F420-dependent oxidoreductase
MGGIDAAPSRPFRFGALVWGAEDRADWCSLARRIEALGYSTLLIGDHMWEQLAPVPAMMAAADATERLRVGALVLANDYHHPVVLAKELATLDVLSDGRLDAGLGAGWFAADYSSAGIPMDSPGTRIDRLEEAVQVMKGLWSGEPFEFSGRHYEVKGLTGSPIPGQRPHPPLFLGGGGPRMLALAARHADFIGMIPALSSGVFGRLRVVREHAGPRLADIELSMTCYVIAAEDDPVALAPQLRRFGIEPDQRHESPQVWLGSPDDVIAQLIETRAALGISYWIVQQDDIEVAAPIVERLAGR